MFTRSVVSQVRAHRGFRGGIVIGLAIALVGILVGTATGATPFQNVIIVNSPASPIPVALQGTGSISGTVGVNNFPATQPVSGTVNVGNFPSTQNVNVTGGALTAGPLVTKTFDGNQVSKGPGETQSYAFGRTINVSTLYLDNDDHGDTMILTIDVVGGGSIVIHHGDGTFTQNFTVPVPATGVSVLCANVLEDCDFFVTALGY